MSQIRQIYTSSIKMPKIYVFKHYPPTPPPPFPGPGTFALNSHTYNTLFEIILDPPLHCNEYNGQTARTSREDFKIFPSESMVSYDVGALFTSVPVDKAVQHIRNRLENDERLENCTLARVLPHAHLFSVQGKLLLTKRRCGH